ncbi:MAG: efflux transporter outer membrane subunit [Roseiarcus sp.]|jgi:NodT family efflux transporter outer membrane factor (OMF) lipoprotein
MRPLLLDFTAALLLAGSLGGCAVGPDNAKPDMALPARWAQAPADARAPSSAASLDSWWRAFKDPLLDELMAEAVAGNTDVASAKAKIREARAARREAEAGLGPSVTGSGSASESKSGQGGGGTAATTVASSSSDPSWSFQAGLDASWELDLFGGKRRDAEAAVYGEQAAEEDLRSALLTLVGDVGAYYAEARGYQARVALARRTLASQLRTADLTRVKFDAGAASAADAAKADAQAATTAADIPSYEAGYVESVHRLSVLTGRAPGALYDRMQTPRAIPAPRRALPAGVPADLLTRRPDVRAAERRVAQATAKIGSAEAALYPDVSLTGSLSTAASRPGDLLRASSVSWSWGPSVSIPIFDGGKLAAERDATQAQRDEYLVAWRSSVLTAMEDVENALLALSQERLRAKQLGSAVDNDRKAADLTRTQYEAGKSSLLDVLDAERSLYSAEDSLIQSRVSLAKDYVALAKALGGGWNAPVDASRPEVADEAMGPRLRSQPAAP